MKDRALFIELSSLNVVYRYNNRFCLSLCYHDNPSRLFEDCKVLGNNFDVYISMLPRMNGNYDFIIPGLSVGDVPFGVNRVEFEQVVNALSYIETGGDIYITNALVNMITYAKPETFTATMAYGNLVGLMTVDNRMLSTFKVYHSKNHLLDEKGDNFRAYSYDDLFALTKFKVQFPEVADVDRHALESLIPLMSAGFTPTRVLLKDIDWREKSKVTESVKDSQGTKQVKLPADSLELDQVFEDHEVEEEQEPLRISPSEAQPSFTHRRPHGLSKAAVGMVVCFCISTGLLGAGFGMSKVSEETYKLSTAISTAQLSAANYRQMRAVYETGDSVCDDAIELNQVLHSSGLAVTISNFEYSNGRFVVRVVCSNDAVKTAFTNYLEQRYKVADINIIDSGLPAPVVEFTAVLS